MGAEREQEPGRRFAILTHDHPFFHWDLLLEVGEVAWTWRLLDEPGPDREIRAERIGDHRLLYLDYEGPVSGDRGRVARWDAGTYRVTDESESEITVVLTGSRSEWTIQLSRFRETSRSAGEQTS
jgi:DNA polymerase Ligase (LigD)